MNRLLIFVLAVVVAILSTMAVRTVLLQAPAAAISAGTPTALAIDSQGAAERLAGAVRFPTVSLTSGGPIDTAAFRGLHAHLQTSFPRLHETLTRDTVSSLSLLYTWQGSDATLNPLVIMGHLDVVPVPEPSLGEWTHLPFAGDVADGFVWGRGTLDDKVTVLAVLEAVEALINSGYTPRRTIYLTFGHDEEVGGRYGARAIVDRLVAQGVKPEMVLDEGGFMGAGLLPGIARRLAIVGIAEKGYVSLRLTSTAEGGHSSMPGTRTAVGALARAVTALEANPFPFALEGPTRNMIEAMAPYLPVGQRVAMANLWITSPWVQRALEKNPMSAALMHTTTSPTMLAAGIKDNVLPPEASAVVNFRIAPGETVESVIARVTQVIGDSLIHIAPIDSVGVGPSAVSSVEGRAWNVLSAAVQGISPSDPPPVIPYLVMGGTDAKYWGPHSDKVYRFLPIPLGDGDRARVHGVNERVSIPDFATSVSFFARLIQGIDQR